MTTIHHRLVRLERAHASAPPSIAIDRGDQPDQPPTGLTLLKLPRKCRSADEWVRTWQHLADR